MDVNKVVEMNIMQGIRCNPGAGLVRVGWVVFVLLVAGFGHLSAQEVAKAPAVVASERVLGAMPSPWSVAPIVRMDLLGMLLRSEERSAANFDYTSGLELAGMYHLPGSPIYLTGAADFLGLYGRNIIIATDSSAQIAHTSLRLGIGGDLTILPWLSLFGQASAGAYLGFWFPSLITDSGTTSSAATITAAGLDASAIGVSLGADAGLRFKLDTFFRMFLGVDYRWQMGLAQYLGITVGAEFTIGTLGGGTLSVPSIDLKPVFPVFYKHYDTSPLGSIQIKNDLSVAISKVSTQVLVKDYMDQPKSVSIDGTIEPGSTRTLDLYALFNEKILNITEGSKAAAEVTITYTADGRVYEDKSVRTLSFMGRNAMTWDDNRKAAAFVSAKDPAVLNFSRSVTSFVRSREKRLVNDNLLAAMALHQALALYGLNYSPNPVTSYETASKQLDVVDFLQFPRETFQYKAGDCSDLSILYAALFQSIGMDAAFITVPGHIYVAFDTRLTPTQAAKELIPSSMIIEQGGHAWIPIEVTARNEGFIKAWQLGAKEWQESNSAKTAGFWPVAEAWKIYQPVGLPGVELVVAPPQSDTILAAYTSEMDRLIQDAIAPEVTRLQGMIDKSQNPAAMNALGILYAKYGQTAKSEAMFLSALATKPDYQSAQINLGHLYFTTEAWTKALGIYRLMAVKDPGNPQVVLALARVNQELQNYAAAKSQFDTLKLVDPDLAAKYAYLGSGDSSASRAAAVGSERRAVEWVDQE